MNLMLSCKPKTHTPLETRLPIIKVIGLGGGGSNAVNRMIELGLQGVEFIAANTDSQALGNSLAPMKIQLGPSCTRGLGAGGNPEVGRKAAEESIPELKAALQGADMVFLTAGMGGGTGTGSIPVAAEIARSTGTVTIGVVSLPFSFEVGRRQKNANEGLSRLRPFTDTLITVPNDRLLKIATPDLTLDLAFRLADDVLRQGIQGITEIITQTGMINVDFSHVRQLMQLGGGSLLSIGLGDGENKALHAVEHALYHPLLEAVPLDQASGIIANFTGGYDLTFQEVTEALCYLQEKTGNNSEIIPGVITDERMVERVQVILVVTGLGATPLDASPIRRAPAKVTQDAEVTRRTPIQAASREVYESLPVANSMDDLDIPAFLRRRR